MKKSYVDPQTLIVLLHGPALMVSGSTNVNNYNKGGDIHAGDDDTPSPSNSIWGNWEETLGSLKS